MQNLIEIAAERSPDEKTWDMLIGVCHDQKILESIIRKLSTYNPFSGEEETELIELVRIQLTMGRIIIPGKSFFSGRDTFNPSEYNWGDIIYALHKSYDWLFNRF